MVLEQKNVENWMYMHLCKNKKIEKRKWDVKIEELISHFSLHVAKGEMKYYSAVRGLEEYILANISIFNGTYEDWKRRRKANQRAERSRRARKDRSKEIQIKQYIMDAVDYYSKVREKYDKELEIKEESRKKSLDETRKYMGH